MIIGCTFKLTVAAFDFGVFVFSAFDFGMYLQDAVLSACLILQIWHRCRDRAIARRRRRQQP
eukprot:3017345-Rhodomonas_salina.1